MKSSTRRRRVSFGASINGEGDNTFISRELVVRTDGRALAGLMLEVFDDPSGQIVGHFSLSVRNGYVNLLGPKHPLLEAGGGDGIVLEGKPTDLLTIAGHLRDLYRLGCEHGFISNSGQRWMLPKGGQSDA